MKCIYCYSAVCIKKGWYKGKQKLYCRSCQRYQHINYKYHRATTKDDNTIVLLCNEGMSISSISRFLQIPKTTVRRRILLVSNKLNPPEINETGQIYEVDEMVGS